MLNSRSERSSRTHHEGPPCANVKSWFQTQKRVNPADVGVPEITPARVIVSPGGRELLTISYQTYGLPGEVQPEPSSDSISASYSSPTYAVGHRSSCPPPGGSVQS